MSAIYVLDSHAVMAFLKSEPGGEQVRAILAQAIRGRARLCMSLINLGEVAYLIERTYDLETALLVLAALETAPIEFAEVSRTTVMAAAHFKAAYPISYADAFAVALTKSLGATLVTGDPEFRRVESQIAIEWLPQREP